MIPDTVVLETAWVLRAVYDLEAAAVCQAFRGVLGLPNVTLNNARDMARVLDWHKADLDFADALHLAASQDHRSLKTFDAVFIKRARLLTNCSVEKP